MFHISAIRSFFVTGFAALSLAGCMVDATADSIPVSESQQAVLGACAPVLRDDVQAIVADLSAISQQADAQGFHDAMQVLIEDLAAILPGLSRPSQAAVQQLITDLQAAVDPTGPAGTSLSPWEQTKLAADIYAVLTSTGMSASDAGILVSDVVSVLSTLEGISTAEIKADAAQLKSDITACLPVP